MRHSTRERIEAWASSGESESLEFKRTTGERKEAARTLCAMLNHLGGRVLFGVELTGRIIGQDVSDRTIEELVQELSAIDPPVFPTIDRVVVDGGREVLVVTVSAGSNQPYSYKGQAYRRVGNTNQPMSRDEYNRTLIERLHGERRWENEIASEWTIDDLDENEIVRTVEEAIRRGRAEDPGTRDPMELLRGLGLIRDGRILRAAAVLFGSNEKIETTYPQCLLRIAKFRGSDRTEFVDNRQFHGNVFELLLRAERFLRENLPIAGRIVPDLFQRVDDPLYPPIALREALANAFCHRDYSIGGGSVAVAIYDDRVEITSSGSLHFGLTVDVLFGPHESLPWNPLIARVFYRRGMIEAWGRGTVKMLELIARAGLPRPEIEDAGGCVTVRFRSSRHALSQSAGQNTTQRQQAILVLLEEDTELPLRDIHSRLQDGTERQVREDLAVLQALGLAYSVGHGRGARWKKK